MNRRDLEYRAIAGVGGSGRNRALAESVWGCRAATTTPHVTGGSRRRLPTGRGGYLLDMAHHSAQRHRLNSPLRNTALLVLLTAVVMLIMLALAASGTYGAMTLILGG